MSLPHDPSRPPYNLPSQSQNWQQPQPGQYNPYAAPLAGGQGMMASRIGLFPTICTVMFVLDLIFCALHVPIGFVNLNELNKIDENPGLRQIIPDSWYTAVKVEMGLQFSCGLLGVLAAAMLLAKQRAGLVLGVLALALALAMIVLKIWFIADIADKIPDDGGPEAQGMKAGLTVVAPFILLVRAAVNVLYVVALVKFAGWLKERQRGQSTAGAAFGPYGGYQQY